MKKFIQTIKCFFIKAFVSFCFWRKPKSTIIWEGTISSEGPEQQGPVTVLALRTEWDKNEWNEGWADGQTDFNAGKEMCNTLNFPISPYARGYFEAYSSAKNRS